MITRRTFFFGAPGIVRYSSLMKLPKYTIVDYAHWAFGGDGVALTSMAHPYSNGILTARDLNEASLVELMEFFVRGYDQYGNPTAERLSIRPLKIVPANDPW